MKDVPAAADLCLSSCGFAISHMDKYTFWMSCATTSQMLLRGHWGEASPASRPHLCEREPEPPLFRPCWCYHDLHLHTSNWWPSHRHLCLSWGVTGGTVLGQVMPCHAYTHQSSLYISYAPWSKTESTKPYSSLAPFPTTFQCSDATALSPQAPSAPQAPLAPPGSTRQLSRFKMISPWPPASKRIHLQRLHEKPSYTPQPLPWPEVSSGGGWKNLWLLWGATQWPQGIHTLALVAHESIENHSSFCMGPSDYNTQKVITQENKISFQIQNNKITIQQLFFLCCTILVWNLVS